LFALQAQCCNQDDYRFTHANVASDGNRLEGWLSIAVCLPVATIAWLVGCD
jgi:hypothetical protein